LQESFDIEDDNEDELYSKKVLNLILEIFKINLFNRALGSAVDVIEVTTGGWMSRLRLKLDDLVTTMT
jgi:hypothetical protein